MFDLYSIESENDDIDVTDEVTVNNETAVDEAGEDSQTVDVSDISEQTAAHNEAASAGGVVVGDGEHTNAADLEMDPVAAEEAYIMKHFGLSREDLEEAVDETIQEAETIPNADVEETDDEELEATSASTGDTSIYDEDDSVNDDEDINDTTSDDGEDEGIDITEEAEISTESIKSILKFSKVEDYFKSPDCESDLKKFKKRCEKKGYKIPTKKEAEKAIIDNAKTPFARFLLKMRNTPTAFLIENNKVTYYAMPHPASARSGMVPSLNIITAPASAIINMAKGVKAVSLFPCYLDKKGKLKTAATAVADVQMSSKMIKELKDFEDYVIQAKNESKKSSEDLIYNSLFY